MAGKHDLLDVDPALTEFNTLNHNFNAVADELQRKLATQFDLAFGQCFTTTQVTTLLQMLGTIMNLPIVMTELEPCYKKVVDYFLNELALVKRTFDLGIKNVNNQGLMALPVDAGLPSSGGILKWIHNLRNRLEMPASLFPYLDYP